MFICNLCGQQNNPEPALLTDPETPSCSRCGSNVRFRWLAHRLSLELFGCGIPLPDLPRDPNIKGLGLTDPDILARRLADLFTYRNTCYDQEPRFDICTGESPFGALDFLIASEVFEHIDPPVERAFRNAALLLKPSGVLLLTVPWVADGDQTNALPELHDWKLEFENNEGVIVNRTAQGDVQRFSGLAFDGGPGLCLGHTREHFPDLCDWKLAEKNNVWTLENRTRQGKQQRFENLSFHQGPGQAIEMRLFTKDALARELFAAGFASVEFEAHDHEPSGIVFSYPWSRPIIARLNPRS